MSVPGEQGHREERPEYFRVLAENAGLRLEVERLRGELVAATGEQGHGDYELVRVSRAMVEQLLNDESQPVVVIGLERMEDGTCEMWLRTPSSSEPRP